ncbi:MAG: tetratricopeptide repeat-containing protein, partial [Bacteroidota bacterium]
MNYSDKTCFVITGFGKKKDRDTSRILDLDKTFKYLIQPVFEELGITCNRASELVHNQIIDVPMYEQILQADVVVADISTLNPNAIYELGVRHALRPHSTIIIAEDKLNFPFDFSHNFVLTYTHMGDDIGMSAVEEFRPKLKKLVKTILDSPAVDSPVYTFLQKLQPPSMAESPKRNKMVARYKREDSSIEANEEILIPSEPGTNQDLSLDELRTCGDQALFAKEFVEAIQYYRRGQELSPHDEYFTHQLCIATYRQPHSSAEEAMEHFQAAETILQRLHPETSTHPETLGLMGSINKRKFEVSPRPEYLTTSIPYYSRGFSLNHNYYTGIH